MNEEMSIPDLLLSMIAKDKPSKYRSVKTQVDGISFDSKKEAKRYSELRLLERAGEISNLELQPRYEIVVNGIYIGRYRADFRFINSRDGKTTIEDVKSKATKTEAYKLRKKIVEAIYGISVNEV